MKTGKFSLTLLALLVAGKRVAFRPVRVVFSSVILLLSQKRQGS
jgi:hypothetical protein